MKKWFPILLAVTSLANAPALPPVPALKSITADEARQGVASDGTYVYAIDNNRIGKYRIADGVRVSGWVGDKALFPHINSCTIAAARLVCAASNYSGVPQTSSVEIFDPKTLRHVGSHSFGITEGSLTVLDWHKGHGWAVFAHYDAKGGEPGKDHRYAQLVKLDANYRPIQRWVFPPEVLAKMKPYSVSGASWHASGVLALSGHDLPEIYFLRLPPAGSILQPVGTIGVTTNGQAIDWDPRKPNLLWSIDRKQKLVVGTDFSGVVPE